MTAMNLPGLGAKNFVIFVILRKSGGVGEIPVTSCMALSDEQVRRWGEKHEKPWSAESQWLLTREGLLGIVSGRW